MEPFDRAFVTLNAVLMIVVLVCIVRLSRSPTDRGYIPGFVLIGVGFVTLSLRQLHIIPPELSFAAKSIALGALIWGGVLVQRLWNSRRSSGRKPS